MDTVYQYTVWIHAAAGVVGLVLFWVPMVLRKGSRQHKRMGNYYLEAMSVAAFSGLAMAVMLLVIPVAVNALDAATAGSSEAVVAQARQRGYFFLLLAFLLLATLQRSKLALVARADRAILRRPVNLLAPGLLVVISLWVAGLASQKGSILYGVFAGLGLFIGPKLVWYAFKPSLKRPEWVIEHLGSVIGSGIAAHTAFFVFGAGSVMSEIFRGQLILIPWVAPSIVGGTAIIWLSSHYSRRLGLKSSRLAEAEGGRVT